MWPQLLMLLNACLPESGAYFLPPEWMAEARLLSHVARVTELREDITVRGIRYPAGSWMITGRRPAPIASVGPLPPLPAADKKPFTLDLLSSPPAFDVAGPAVEWLPDGKHYLQVKQYSYRKVHAESGESTPFAPPDKLYESLKAIPEIPFLRRCLLASCAQAQRRWNFEKSALVVPLGNDFLYVFKDGTPAVRLTRSAAKKELFVPAPGGKYASYVSQGNLYVAEVASGKNWKLTNDGSETILNGRADWVYEEEIFHRDGRAYWWNRTGEELIFLRFDDTHVPEFKITETYPNEGGLETIRYPKAGAPNPLVTIGVATMPEGKVSFLNLGERDPKDLIVTRVGFRPDGIPYAYLQNRLQNQLELVIWPDRTGEPKRLYHERSEEWIEDLGEPHFLKDGSILLLSERSGFRHLLRVNGEERKLLTSGEWEIRSIERVDDEYVYFLATRDDPTGTNLYRLPLAGGELVRLSSAGSHQVKLAPQGELYLDRMTDDTTPPRSFVRKLEPEGKPLRVVDSNPAREWEAYRFGKAIRLRLPTREKFLMEGMLFYPPDFDPSKKYPLWVLTYAGPHTPTIRTGWAPRLLERIVAELGIVVLKIDPRSASGQGYAHTKRCYRRLGVHELEDLEDAVEEITKNRWADPTRVGISGHSFGGFISAYALTHSKKFSAAIAGAPVTDWRLYDSIYTERYMGLPKENAQGYDETSVVKGAKNLQGKLLIVHGLVDDNVHFQQSAQLIDALQKAGKEFEVMVYPSDRHGIPGPHYPRLMVKFIQKTMNPSSR